MPDFVEVHQRRIILFLPADLLKAAKLELDNPDGRFHERHHKAAAGLRASSLIKKAT
jgi:hypothetical protein